MAGIVIRPLQSLKRVGQIILLHTLTFYILGSFLPLSKARRFKPKVLSGRPAARPDPAPAPAPAPVQTFTRWAADAQMDRETSSGGLP